MKGTLFAEDIKWIGVSQEQLLQLHRDGENFIFRFNIPLSERTTMQEYIGLQNLTAEKLIEYFTDGFTAELKSIDYHTHFGIFSEAKNKTQYKDEDLEPGPAGIRGPVGPGPSLPTILTLEDCRVIYNNLHLFADCKVSFNLYDGFIPASTINWESFFNLQYDVTAPPLFIERDSYWQFKKVSAELERAEAQLKQLALQLSTIVLDKNLILKSLSAQESISRIQSDAESMRNYFSRPE